MELIHFEKQEARICAQHALNALLQGPFFTAVDLATIANTIDEEERSVMAEGGIDSAEYCQFIQAGSHNMDDSGFFSFEVISRALKVWNLELVRLKNPNHPLAIAAQVDPVEMNAFICNFREHWFTIRKLGYQWFSLNSMLERPELISDTYLQILLCQLENDGYSIFVVGGELPPCEAHSYLMEHPVDPSLAGLSKKTTSSPSPSSTKDETDSELQAALERSADELDSEEPSLKRILSQTRRDHESEDMESALVASIKSQEEEELQKALAISMMQPESLTETTQSVSMSSLSADDLGPRPPGDGMDDEGCDGVSTLSRNSDELMVGQEAAEISCSSVSQTTGTPPTTTTLPNVKPVTSVSSVLVNPANPVPSTSTASAPEADSVNPEELRRRRAAFLDRLTGTGGGPIDARTTEA